MNKILLQPTISLMNHPAVMEFLTKKFQRMVRLTGKNKEAFKRNHGPQVCCLNSNGHRMWVWQVNAYRRKFLVFSGARGTSYEMITDMKVEEFASDAKVGRDCIKFLKYMETSCTYGQTS